MMRTTPWRNEKTMWAVMGYDRGEQHKTGPVGAYDYVQRPSRRRALGCGPLGCGDVDFVSYTPYILVGVGALLLFGVL